MTRRRPNGYERYLNAVLALQTPIIWAARRLLYQQQKILKLEQLGCPVAIMRVEHGVHDARYEKLLEETQKYLSLIDKDLKDAGMSDIDIKRLHKSAAAILREKD